MVKGEILEITVCVMATGEMPDAVALTYAATTVEDILTRGPGGIPGMIAMNLATRVSSGVSICARHTRLARTRRHTIHGHGTPPPTPTEPKPS